jgi:hypothetical protein
MKNRIEGLLISLAVMALPVCSFAQVSSGSAVPSLPVSSNPIQLAVSTGLASVEAASQCIESSVTGVNFVLDTATNPPTYTFKYTCTFTVNGGLQPVVSDVQNDSGTCLPAQSPADCKKMAMGDANKSCSTMCASYP